MIWIKRLFIVAFLGLLVAAMVAAFQPQPVRVDVQTIQRGPLTVTVRDDGVTRLRERYVVSTPIAGRLRRIALDVGDSVTVDETILARLDANDPTLLDPRAAAQARARVQAAEGRLRQTEVTLNSAQAELDHAEKEFVRIQQLVKNKAGNQQELDGAQLLLRLKTEELRSVEFQKEILEYELKQEQAALLHFSDDADSGSEYEFVIKSPITGRVLKLFQESTAVVTPGAPLLELGDPSDLEVIVDVLSSDAVRILPGQRVSFEHWGGDHPLSGVVRLVEPSGFTKLSALGVEEQRVNVVIDFAGSHSARLSLGDGYRVEANIIVWEAENVIQVSTGALFRDGDDWAVFVVEDERAVIRHIQVGENNGLFAEVKEGLSVGELVILHPSDQVKADVQVVTRG